MRVGRATTVATFVALGATIARGAPWWGRALAVFVPAAVAATSFLEALGSVCVVGAARGTYEHDDRSKTVMDPGQLPAIRRAAASIIVRSLVVALLAAGAAALTALLR